MAMNKYFEKTGKVYGVSSKYTYTWTHHVSVFDNLAEAEEWLNTEQGDFRERELMTKTAAEKLAGKSAVRCASLR